MLRHVLPPFWRRLRPRFSSRHQRAEGEDELPSIDWLEPWCAVGEEGKALENELRRELSRKHVLRGKEFRAIGRRIDNDDVLFEVLGDSPRYAVVHLTWRRERQAQWPWTMLYDDLATWRTECMMEDHIDRVESEVGLSE